MTNQNNNKETVQTGAHHKYEVIWAFLLFALIMGGMYLLSVWRNAS